MSEHEVRAHQRHGENRYAVRAAARVLDILDLLQQSADAVTLADVAEATGLPKSSAFRYLATMESRGYVQRDTAGYHLGIGFLSSRAPRLEVLAVRARPVLEEVRDRFDETVNLAVLDGTRAVYLEIVESRRGMRFAARRGDREPIHSTALGQGDRLDLGLRPCAGHPCCRRNAATHTSHHHRPRSVRAGRDDGGPRRLRGRRPGERGGRPLRGSSAGRRARSRRSLAVRPRQPTHRGRGGGGGRQPSYRRHRDRPPHGRCNVMEKDHD